MSTRVLQSLYSRLRGSSAAPHVGLCVFVSLDGQQFHSYPPSIFGTFENVLPSLRTTLAVQASGPGIQAAITEAPWPQDEVHLGYGCSVPIVDTAAQLTGSTAGYIRSAAFMRSDASLVLWGDSEGQILYSFEEILSSIHNRYDTTVPNPDPFAALSDGFDLDGSLFNDLPPLVEFSSLATVPDPTAAAPIISSQAYTDASLYPTWHSESPRLGGLQLALHASSASSPSSENSAFSFGGSPWFFMDSSLNPAFLTNFSGGEEATSDVSLLSTASSDGVASPVLSASSEGTTLQQAPPSTPATATGPSSFRRHSFGEASAPLGYAAVQKAKRAVSEHGDYVPKININGESLDRDVDVHQNFVPDVRAPKRLRPVATPTSAPALLTPLPTASQPEESNARSSSIDEDRTSPAPVPTPTPTTTTRRPASTRTTASSSGSGSAHRRSRKRTGPTRTKRAQCPYCNKTFSRVQDAQRHILTSCAESPDKAGVECPECGSVLSRLDAAQRHWRGHENPGCEAPEWALRA